METLRCDSSATASTFSSLPFDHVLTIPSTDLIWRNRQEVSAYNVFRKHGLGDLVDHDLKEHHEIKQLAYKADTTLFSNEAYDEILVKAAQAFISHAEEVRRLLCSLDPILLVSLSLGADGISFWPSRIDRRRKTTSYLSSSPR